MILKDLLLLAVLCLAFHLWRQRRHSAERPRPKPPPVIEPKATIRCAHCGLHLPVNEAVAGRHGSYCCAAHRHAAES